MAEETMKRSTGDIFSDVCEEVAREVDISFAKKLSDLKERAATATARQSQGTAS